MTTGGTEATGQSRTSGPAGWPARTAGGLMVLVGLANTAFGVLALATDLVRLSPPTSGGLLVAGVLTALTGMLVWDGSRLALALSLTVFVILLVLQLGDLAGSGADAAGVAPRLVVLGLLVASLALAQLRPSRRS